MIYAKLDVDFYDHPRFTKAGLAATGLWAVSLAYCRKHAFNGEHPGRFPKDVDFLRRPGGAAAATKLVEVGLWIDCAEDYELRNYEAKNETKEDIELRRSGTRMRVSRLRERERNAYGNAPCNAVSNADVTPVTNDPVTGSVPGSRSGTGSDQKFKRDPEVFSGVLSAVPQDIPITEQIRSDCFARGAPMPTNAHVLACLSNARKKGYTRADWGAELVDWMARERQFARSGKHKVQPAPDNAPWLDPNRVADEPSREAGNG